jgi:hypothetical protein
MTIIQHPIGGGVPALSPSSLHGISMSPRVKFNERGVRAVEGDDRRMDALAALEPAEDPELAPLVLQFTEDDETEMRRLAEDLEEACKLATQAEQRHTAANRIARTLPYLNDTSGRLSAKAFRGTKADKDALAAHNAKVAEAQEAEAALRGLKEELDEAARFKDGCYGRLRVFTNKALAAMRSRAAAAYAFHAERLRVCLAAIDVSLELQARDRDVAMLFQAWHGSVMGTIKIPAILAEFRGGANGVEHQMGGDLLVSYGHSYLTGQQSAIRSRLQTQIAEACASVGLTHNNLL